MENYYSLNPITESGQDQLGRESFVNHFAKALAAVPCEEGVVVSLYGDFGDGKSSVKNLTKNVLRELSDKPLVIDFNPWDVSGIENIQDEFYRTLCYELGLDATSERLKRAAAMLKAYADRTKIFKPAAKYIKYVGLIPGVGSASDVASAALDAAAGPEADTELIGQLEKMADDSRSLAAMKKDISDALREIDNRLIVFIDDLDRLLPDEVVSVLRLLKAAAGFPNVVYVILAQKSYIQECVHTVYKSDIGIKFLDKIVQVDITLPPPTKDQIQKSFIASVNGLLNVYKTNHERDERHRANLFEGGIIGCLKNLRDVNKVLNSLAFTLGAVSTNDVLEVNEIDIVGIEMLRVLESEVHAVIPNHYPVLTGDTLSWYDRIEKPEDIKNTLDDLLSRVQNCDSNAIKEVLCELFPRLGGRRGYETALQQYDRLRICRPEFFHRYFELSISTESISQYELSKLAGSKSYDEIVDLLRAWSTKDLLWGGLRDAPKIIDKIPANLRVQLIKTIFVVGESKLVADSWASRKHNGALMCVREVLKKETSSAARLETLREAIVEGGPISMPSAFVSFIEHNPKRPEQDVNEILSDEDQEQMEEYMSRLLNECSQNGRLIETPDLLGVIFSWKSFSGVDTVKGWFSELVEKPNDLLRVASAFVTTTTSSSFDGKRHSEVTRIRIFRIEWITDLIDIDVLAKIIHDADGEEYSELKETFGIAYSNSKEGVAEE